MNPENNTTPPPTSAPAQATQGAPTLLDFSKYYRVTTVAPTSAGKKPKTVYNATVIVVDSLTAPTTAKLYMYAAAIKKWTYVALTIV